MGSGVADPRTALRSRLDVAIRANTEAIAHVDQQGARSYGELVDRVDTLLSSLGGAPSIRRKPVLVVVDDAFDSYVAMLACFLADAQYVPLHAAQGLARARAVVERAQPHLVLADSSHLAIAAASTGSIPLFATDTNHWIGAARPEDGNNDRDPGYLLFTSGTTGTPKGVPISTTKIAAMLDSFERHVQIQPNDRVAQTFALTFDLSVYSTLAAWLAGACVSPLNDIDLLDPPAVVSNRGLTVWFSVPSLGDARQSSRQPPAARDAHAATQHVLRRGATGENRARLARGDAVRRSAQPLWTDRSNL